MELTREERVRFRAQIGCSLAVLQLVRFFWSAAHRRLYARSAFRPVDRLFRPCRGRGGALPADAVLVGLYQHGGISSADVLGDLEDLISSAPEHAPATCDAGRQAPHEAESIDQAIAVAQPRCDRELVRAVRTRPPAPFNPTFAPPKTPALDHPYRVKMVLRTAERRAKRRLEARAAMQLSKLV